LSRFLGKAKFRAVMPWSTGGAPPAARSVAVAAAPHCRFHGAAGFGSDEASGFLAANRELMLGEDRELAVVRADHCADCR
jgi:hypothetical protein